MPVACTACFVFHVFVARMPIAHCELGGPAFRVIGRTRRCTHKARVLGWPR